MQLREIYKKEGIAQWIPRLHASPFRDNNFDCMKRLQAEMDSVFDAVRRIRNRIHYALTLAQRAWVSWVFKPSKQEKPSIEPKIA
jgi:hypothetical protein